MNDKYYLNILACKHFPPHLYQSEFVCGKIAVVVSNISVGLYLSEKNYSPGGE
jgi:hypothetical protein